VAALATIACSRTYDVNPEAQQAIGFGTWAETMTKQSLTQTTGTFAVDDNFKVYGIKTVNTTNTTVFNGVTVTKKAASPETWDYSPKQYWDASASSYTFYAIAPAADGYTVDAATGAISVSPTITFTGKDSDILVAQQNVVNETDGSGNFNSFAAVPLIFNHAAALVDVKVKISAGLVAAGATVQVSSIELQNISTEGTYTVAGGYTTAPAAVWTPSTPAAGTTGAFDADDGSIDASTNLNVDLDDSGLVLINSLVVLPQDFRTTGDYIQKLNIAYNITQTGGSATNYTPAAFNLKEFDTDDDTSNDASVTGWAPGTHYTYIVTIDAHTIEFTASISDWSTTDANAYYYLVD